MRILVTGGAGFIGSHFAKRLIAAGDEVIVLDKMAYSGNRANLEEAIARGNGKVYAVTIKNRVFALSKMTTQEYEKEIAEKKM